jgi:hypothetical protein
VQNSNGRSRCLPGPGIVHVIASAQKLSMHFRNSTDNCKATFFHIITETRLLLVFTLLTMLSVVELLKKHRGEGERACHKGVGRGKVVFQQITTLF